MYDYKTNVENYFKDFYNSLSNSLMITVTHNVEPVKKEFPLSLAPLIQFDDFHITTLYLPIEMDNVDDVFTINSYYTFTDMQYSKAYLTLISQLSQQIVSLKTLLEITKFTI